MNQKLTYRCGGSEGIINALSGNAPISQFHLVCRKQTWHLTTSADYIDKLLRWHEKIHSQ